MYQPIWSIDKWLIQTHWALKLFCCPKVAGTSVPRTSVPGTLSFLRPVVYISTEVQEDHRNPFFFLFTVWHTFEFEFVLSCLFCLLLFSMDLRRSAPHWVIVNHKWRKQSSPLLLMVELKYWVYLGSQKFYTTLWQELFWGGKTTQELK